MPCKEDKARNGEDKAEEEIASEASEDDDTMSAKDAEEFLKGIESPAVSDAEQEPVTALVEKSADEKPAEELIPASQDGDDEDEDSEDAAPLTQLVPVDELPSQPSADDQLALALLDSEATAKQVKNSAWKARVCVCVRV